MKKFLLCFSLVFILSSCFFEDHDKKHTTDAMQAVVDTYFAAATVKAGISVALYKDGYTWTYATGSAADGTAMTTSTPTFAYSVTKTIVSAMVLKQIEHGDYTLDNTVDSLLSGDSDGYATLSTEQKAYLNTGATVKQLLMHTSGMPDYAVTNPTGILPLCDPAVNWSPVYILEHIVNQGYKNVGTFNYSNTNYILLGMIAEHKGNDTLNDLLSTAFFSPLKLDIILAPQDDVPLNIAEPYDDAALFGYSPADSFYYITDMLSMYSAYFPNYDFYTGAGRGTWAAGGIIATAENLAKWGYALYDSCDSTIISSAERNTIKASAATDGAYGYGVTYNTFTYNDGTTGKLYGHSGSAVGYKTILEYEANQRISVVILTNANNLYDNALHPSYSDSQLGIVDRIGLAEALLKTYNDNN